MCATKDNFDQVLSEQPMIFHFAGHGYSASNLGQTKE